ncbi:polycomb group protein EMBRYONIC FLOWER 2-like isoform X1 [Zingiber officinale]|uniref:polycomb group protein EMBRYONIC FLOWER 2-like isoform X1 n=2 Tax=Zingiber officinale TaxID=94328 RepID=UPI001C4B9FCD|nr:polycomb group protein EMBRYONIC FLOWER 2-like isoform X1 [Zingiber officinale]XP_042427637.1 polycomb group protein EMBRYONIC FLOWER 2-like isoform X1 [Zingiber officinale]
MPGLPLAVRDTMNHGFSCSHSRTNQMCRQQSRVRLTTEEQLAAEESLSVYCKPVELYNILQRRAIQNPSFLQRSLLYKIQAKHKRRIQITISLIGSLNAEIEPQRVFPLYVLLARPIADTLVAEHSSMYQLSRPCVLTNFAKFGNKDEAEASFLVPEIKKLTTDARVNNLDIIIISKGESNGGCGEYHLSKDSEEWPSFLKCEGKCLWGKIAVNSLCLSMEKSVTLSLGHQVDMLSAVSMKPSILQPKYLESHHCIFFQTQNMDSASTCQVQVSISAQEVGASEISPYDLYSYDDIPTSSLPHIIRLRKGNVLFNYRYYNNLLQKTEVTEDFSCPFCLAKCASFKGLRYHLNSSHDLFNFEFWVTEEYQAVNVSVRTDTWSFEIASDGNDPRLQTFFYRSNFKRCRRSKNNVQTASHVHPHVLEAGSPEGSLAGSRKEYDNKDNGICYSQRPYVSLRDGSLTNGLNDEGKSCKSLLHEAHLMRHKSEISSQHCNAEECTRHADTIGICASINQASTSNDFTQQASATNLASQSMLQFAKTRKISDERADPRNRALLQKRQFFHSHRAQPMASEQVFLDWDSEDEVDDDIADFEDRRMLDDFVDVTRDEKQIMHLWNSFVRKQRVLADGHVPWACEAFSQLHGQDLMQSPALMRCWKLFMVKLWNHSLLDARTMNNCSLILERFQNESSGPKQS